VGVGKRPALEVHGLGVADDHGQPGQKVEDVLRSVSADGLAGSHPIAVVGELGREGPLGEFGCRLPAQLA